MTRRDQFIQSRAWLKIQSYVITNSLREKLETIPSELHQGLCFIQNMVLVFTDEFEGEFVCIPTTVWKDKLGTTYGRYVQQLKQLGELEIKEDFRWSKDKSGYPMSYTIPAAALGSGTQIIDFRRKRVRLPRPKNTPTGPVSNYALHCLQKLNVAEKLAYPPPENALKDANVRQARIRKHCEHIMGGDFSLRYGKKAKRLYHRVLTMPKEGRCNLVYWTPLAEYDVRSCHPFLMLKLFADPVERAEYAEILTRDIYSQIGIAMGIDSREQVKDDLQRVVNIGHKTPDWMAKQYVFQFYHSRFPNFAEQVLFSRKDLAEYLQNLEAFLMVQQLGNFCLEENLFWIPMHDGFIARIDQGRLIADRACGLIKDAIGYTPLIECKPIKHPHS